MMKKTPYYSYLEGSLAKGCQQCVQGRKLVLFVTGLCSRECFYCPISDVRKKRDTIFANEWRLKDENDTDAILEEARLTEAHGAGVTGGDPLVKIDRTARYIKLLKKEFGKDFHIHLYAPLNLVNDENLKKLHEAGLDEIRFHPGFNDDKYWNKIGLIRNFDWDVGVEIPAIPGMEKQTIKMIDYFRDRIKFLNINELEISDTNAQYLVKRGFAPKDDVSYGVKGSQELALSILKRYAGKLNMHYCTTTLKDRVQLANRIKLRAKNVRKAYDFVTRDSMLVRGAIYAPELMPGYGYRKRIDDLSEKDAEKIIKKLEKAAQDIRKKVKDKMIGIDRQKLRLLTSTKILKKIAENVKQENMVPAIVTEYPTWDHLEMEVEFI